MKKHHWIWMIISCGLPLLFIFLAPLFGIRGGSSLFIFIILMFAFHLFMPHGSHGGGEHGHAEHIRNKSSKNKERSIAETNIEEHKGH